MPDNPALNSLFTSDDVTAMMNDRLLTVARRYFPNITLSPSYLLQQLQAAEAEVARTLRVFLQPTFVFPPNPSEGDIATYAVDGESNPIPWVEEPGYDYGPGFFDNDTWGYLVVRHKPIISVTSMQFVYPAPTQGLYTIPSDWIRLDKKYGVIRLVPASSTFIAPLGAFLLQALGGGTTIPQMIAVRYLSGLQNVKTDPRWADLLDAIYKLAVCKVIDGLFLPSSGSISADGLSQSLSVNAENYRNQVDVTLVGPKGSNGGLRTFIHGATMVTLGGLT